MTNFVVCFHSRVRCRRILRRCAVIYAKCTLWRLPNGCDMYKITPKPSWHSRIIMHRYVDRVWIAAQAIPARTGIHQDPKHSTSKAPNMNILKPIHTGNQNQFHYLLENTELNSCVMHLFKQMNGRGVDTCTGPFIPHHHTTKGLRILFSCN